VEAEIGNQILQRKQLHNPAAWYHLEITIEIVSIMNPVAHSVSHLP